MQRVIASIFYHALQARRPYRRRDSESGFNTNFAIPAAPRDGYHLLTIYDMEEDYQFSSESGRTIKTKETTADMVASDLATEWGGNVANEAVGKPGIWICRDLDEKDDKGKVVRPADKPSERELALHRASQTRWCELWCLEAADFARTGKSKLISDAVHVAAAKWLGKQYPWMQAQEQVFVSECPVCGAEMKPSKFKCISCGEIIDPLGYENWQKGTRAAQIEIERLKQEALKANPQMDPAELDMIGVGAIAQPKPEGEKKPGGRHVYG